MKDFEIDGLLENQIKASLYLQLPLPVDDENSFDKISLGKKVLAEKKICGNRDGWQSIGAGEISDKGRGIFRMTAPTTGECWPVDNPEGDYTPFSRQSAVCDLYGEDWTAFNRLRFRIFPECPGARSVYLEMFYVNDGMEKIPDEYGREGCHCVNLINHEWNECFWDIGELPRDKVTSLGFARPAFGKDVASGDYWQFDIGNIRLQNIENPEKSLGWGVADGHIAYSHSGYELHGKKTAVANYTAEQFRVKDDTGRVVLESRAVEAMQLGERFAILDFTQLTIPGAYTIEYGALKTRPFHVSNGVWGSAVWKALNFIFCERCGMPVPGKHGHCHGDILAEHNGVKIAYNGGWHDAGDLSQQTLQTADVTYALLEIAKKADGALRSRLILEAEWGLNFLLKCRFGDGFYASSAGLVHWSDNRIGNFDDRPARVHDNSLDNFIYAACYAEAAAVIEDRTLIHKLTVSAIEDFEFAHQRYETQGFHEMPLFWEHSYNTSFAQYMATMAFSAAAVYELTENERYREIAVNCAKYVMNCQNTEGIGGIRGFFYRDADKRVIQHFNHQSREEIFARMFAKLLSLFSDHADSSAWENALSLYGGYLKDIASHALPYGMLPAGIYGLRESEDTESFNRQHLHANPLTAARDFKEQVMSGERLDDDHYLKMFPVWLSFRGNSAIHLSMGKAAALCANALGDPKLTDIAREQLYWVVGKNPFCQSLMYGEGHHYPEQAVFLPGTMTGQLPVGIQTRHNRDEPYWPHTNNATYKEVWLSVAGKWLSLVAEVS